MRTQTRPAGDTLAHIDAERALESAVERGATALSSAFIQQAHRELYSRLIEADRLTAEGEVIQPGESRTRLVAVGCHEPPPPDALPAFLARFDQIYARPPLFEDQLIVAAAAHQRMAWIHPFIDGNGRACRLQTIVRSGR